MNPACQTLPGFLLRGAWRRAAVWSGFASRRGEGWDHASQWFTAPLVTTCYGTIAQQPHEAETTAARGCSSGIWAIVPVLPRSLVDRDEYADDGR